MEIDMVDVILKTYDYVAKYHGDDTSGHDFEHIRRVYINACKILEGENGADTDIVKIAALLHDVDDWKINDKGNIAGNWMDNVGVSPVIKSRVLKIISSIGFASGGENPVLEDIETKIVYDADKLDAIGAIGIARAFAFGGSRRTPMFQPNIFPDADFDISKYKDLSRKENTTINHFFDKLLRLKKIMQTSAGRKEAVKRQEVMINFLVCFFEEQNQTVWLNYLWEFLRDNNL
jgi:uncharacterized protein